MSQKIKGFKAMHQDMTCRGFQYKVGETYKHKDSVIPCISGFHFCRNIEDIKYYYNAGCRVFEVEASGVIVEDDRKAVTDTLTIVKEIDYMDYINHEDHCVRSMVGCAGYGLDVLIHDKSPLTRAAIASNGLCLDSLVHDKHWLVRATVAEKGYGRDILINDEDLYVRSKAMYFYGDQNANS